MVEWKRLAGLESAAVAADKLKAQVLLAALTAEIAPIARLEATAWTAWNDAKDAEENKALATSQLGADAVVGISSTTPATHARGVVVAAQVAVDSITEQRKYHQGRVAFETEKTSPLYTIMNNASMMKDKAAGDYDSGLAKLDMLRDQCKQEAFGRAQENLQKITDDGDARAAKVLEVSTAYATLTAFATGPAVGALCNYPQNAGDAQPARAVDCGEDLCCGAAQRFMKDGTKLSIETCQQPETTTYTYYPGLPDGALVAPAKETWRFACISAAGNLAASVAAALATGYMLA